MVLFNYCRYIPRSGIAGYYGELVFDFLDSFLATPHGIQDLSSPTREQIHSPCSGSGSLNHWTAGKSLCVIFEELPNNILMQS